MTLIQVECYGCQVPVDSFEMTVGGRRMLAPMRCEQCVEENRGTPPPFVVEVHSDGQCQSTNANINRGSHE
jgi:hypothetical protein